MEDLKDILPTCAICNKPVDEIHRREDFNGDLVFAVFCHGEKEETTIDRELLVKYGPSMFLKAGVAFQFKKLGRGDK